MYIYIYIIILAAPKSPNLHCFGSKSQVLFTCPGANQMVRGCPLSPLASETCQICQGLRSQGELLVKFNWFNHWKVLFKCKNVEKCGKMWKNVERWWNMMEILEVWCDSSETIPNSNYQQDTGESLSALPVDHIPAVAPPTARALPRCRSGRNPGVWCTRAQVQPGGAGGIGSARPGNPPPKAWQGHRMDPVFCWWNNAWYLTRFWGICIRGWSDDAWDYPPGSRIQWVEKASG